jgi:hypothetical protein
MKNKMMVHGNVLKFTKDLVLYKTHDGYKLFVDLLKVDSNEKANDVLDEVLGFVQEIADNGSEGTFLTGIFYDFVVDNIKWRTGFSVVMDQCKLY